jgi:hypothetical protein
MLLQRHQRVQLLELLLCGWGGQGSELVLRATKSQVCQCQASERIKRTFRSSRASEA